MKPLLIALALVMALSVTGCGRRPARLDAPEGTDPHEYPHQYPDPLLEPAGTYYASGEAPVVTPSAPVTAPVMAAPASAPAPVRIVGPRPVPKP